MIVKKRTAVTALLAAVCLCGSSRALTRPAEASEEYTISEEEQKTSERAKMLGTELTESGSTDDNTEGGTDGGTEGETDGGAGGGTEDGTEGDTDGATEGNTEGSTDGNTDGNADDTGNSSGGGNENGSDNTANTSSTDSKAVDSAAAVTETLEDQYRVEITWSVPTLTAQQTERVTYRWDAENCRYIEDSSNTGISSDQGCVYINIVNKSNTGIHYSITETDLNGYTLSHDVTGAESGTLAGTSGEADISDRIRITGLPEDGEGSNVQVARYVVFIS